MTGEVKETYLSDLHSRTRDESQASFNQFTSDDTSEELGTTIAVVTEPTGGITDVTDEFIPVLGMPEEELNVFRQRRSKLEEEITDDVKRHNQAANEVNLEQRYRSHITSDTDAKREIDQLIERVRDGETITLVCFEKQPKWCHRHVLKEHIEKKL